MSRLMEQVKRVESPTGRLVLLRGRGAIHAAARGHLVRRRAVARYLASTDEPRLQFGGGPQDLPGWLNGDLIAGDVYLDCERRLPFPDASFAYAFGEHVIEHIGEHRIDRFLSELHRILRPGGVLRVVTPDLRRLIEIYDDRNPHVSRDTYAHMLDSITGKPHAQPAQILNDAMRLWGHRHIFDEPDLTARLLAAGFARVERVQPGTSAHAALQGIERHGPEPWVNTAEAMLLEATRS